jgi:NAD(P)-dependent dehydrogenase (short-subunit alcohol dehydrogenase family)
VKAEHGRLDILVNNAAKLIAAPLVGGFWQKPLESVDLITVGLRSHFVAAYYAAPLLIANGRGLIVNTGHYGSVSHHSYGPAYGAQKAGADKMAADMAKELRPYNIAAVSIWMGALDTERARVPCFSPERLAAQAQTRITAIHRKGGRGAVRVRPAYDTLGPRFDWCRTRSKARRNRRRWYRSNLLPL